MFKITKKILLTIIFLAILFFSAPLAFAVPPANNAPANVNEPIEITPPIRLEEFGIEPGMEPKIAVPIVIARLVEGFLGIIGALAVFFIVQGAIKYAYSGGNEALIKEAKTQVMYAIVGLIVAIVSFVIVETVLGILKAGV